MTVKKKQKKTTLSLFPNLTQSLYGIDPSLRCTRREHALFMPKLRHKYQNK